MTNDELWQATLGELELLISKANFSTWLKETFISEIDQGRVVVGVPNLFTKGWLETKYHQNILKALENITGQPVTEVTYRVESARGRTTSTKPKNSATQLTSASAPASAGEAPRVDAVTKGGSNLNPGYTFDTFIVGKGNELARAAAMAVADRPGQVYNPLFIYGGVGLGKTHLMQAVGHKILEKDPKKKVLYVTSEQFTNEFIQAIQKGNGESFKRAYRNIDALLVDDIQFLTGKEGTQEEFFHTFNALHQSKKQVIITSDRPPKSIPAIEHRLISRFEWGMVADIAQPDLETRRAILEAKCDEKSYKLPIDVLNYIATHVQSNVRELEGALNRIMANAQLKNEAVTVETVKRLLASLTNQPRRGGLTPKQVVQVVASFFDIRMEDLLGTSRKKELVVPRQISMYLIREEIKASFPAIGQELGGRDHTTAMHACLKIAQELETSEKIRQDVALIRQRLYN
jgi:chromosomal replication initiator protein